MAVSAVKSVREIIRKESNEKESPTTKYHYTSEFFKLLSLCNTIVCEKDLVHGGV
jgi:hypothetical protein